MNIGSWIVVVASVMLLVYIAYMHYQVEQGYKKYRAQERELLSRLDAMLDYYLAGQPYGNTQKGFLLWMTEQEEQKQKGHTHHHEEHRHDTGTDQRSHPYSDHGPS